jgi:transposase
MDHLTSRRRDRQRLSFPEGPRVRGVARTCPATHSTGGKPRFFGISKRGNSYLRKILVHGARSAILRVKRERSPFGPWLDVLERRAPVKVVVTAAANKLARVAWAVLSSGDQYRSPTRAVAV